jgi:hypothetical protein
MGRQWRDAQESSRFETSLVRLTAQSILSLKLSLGTIDLLRAAMEAQSLGRLKMASAYQLLLHARLVGLGKRFDRAVLTHGPSPGGRRRRREEEDEEDYDNDDEQEYSEHDYDDEEEDHEGSADDYDDDPDHVPDAAAVASGILAAAVHGAPPSALLAGSSTATPSTMTTAPHMTATLPVGLPPALQQLTSILPSNLEMDVTMMEHLARAAVELHHQRTGRKKSADGLLASPMTGLMTPPENDASAFGYKKDPGSADKAAGAASNGNSNSSNSSTININNKIAWTQDEQDVVSKAQSSNPKVTPSALSKLLKNKTEAQVKAYLKNLSHRAKNHLEVEEEMTPRKRGGRGRKPATTPMNTVPNANLDARALLQGKILKISKTSLSSSSTPASR